MEARAMMAAGAGADIPGARFFELPVGASTVLSAWAPTPDGKVVVCGHNADVFLARLSADGSLDTTFGPGQRGWIFQDVMFAMREDVATGVFVQPDGKIVVSGTTGGQLAVALRFMPDGTLDASFGNVPDRTYPLGVKPGVAVVNWTANGASGVSAAEAVAPGPGGTIYLAGRAPSGTRSDLTAFAVARLTPDGALDASFGEPRPVPLRPGEVAPPGWSLVEFAAERPDYATSLQVLPDGRLLLSGLAWAPAGKRGKPISGTGVAMLDATGRSVAGFGNGATMGLPAGTSFLPSKRVGGAVTAALQPDGKLVTAGFDVTTTKLVIPHLDVPQDIREIPAHVGAWVGRFNPDGNPDPSFGKRGSLRAPAGAIGTATSLSVGADGRILVGSLSAADWQTAQISGYAPGVLRLNANGTLDRTFGPGRSGVVSLPFGPGGGGAIILPAGAIDGASGRGGPWAERALVVPRPDGSTMVLSGAGETLRVAALPASPPTGADLVVSAPSMATFGGMQPNMIASVVPGLIDRRARVKVTNAGTAPAAGTVRVRLLASKDAAADATDTVLAESAVVLRLGPRRSRTVKLPFTWPDLRGQGDFFVLSQVLADAVPEAEPANNTAVVPLKAAYGG
jgi:uncharacterized delta-60 repeat protein